MNRPALCNHWRTTRRPRERRTIRVGSLIGVLVGLAVMGLTPVPLFADFDLNAYFDHLEQTQDLDARGLLRDHEPFGPYQFRIPPVDDVPAYLEEIDEWLHLTEGERSLLEKHGFVVSERWRERSFGDAFAGIWMRDLPVFISSDAILHAVHKSYDDLLALTERRYLLDQLNVVLNQMHHHWPRLRDRYGQDTRMEVSLGDVDVYVTVAMRLLNPDSHVPSQSGNDELVQRILSLVRWGRPARIALFNDVERDYDFSQFRPRGHYVDDKNPPLEDYFRTVMWLGRTEFRLTPPETTPALDVTREIIDACLLMELARESGAVEGLNRIDQVIRTLVGFPDNIVLDELARLTEAIGLESCASLLEPGVLEAFHDELATGEYSTQLILSQILKGDWCCPELVRPPYAFLLMGQRFLIDSFVTGQVVWPFVEHEPPRLMPDPLDVLYCLGNDDVLPLLKEEIETYDYAPNLSALRYIIDSQDGEFWHGSLYNSWLQAIRTLAESGVRGNVSEVSARRKSLPMFMRTGAWQQEKMNTQLAAWAELRHDNLLYGKQSYTGDITCEFPFTYVEPIPSFYGALERFAEEAGDAFSGIPGLPEGVPSFFSYMRETMQRLREIAEKELDGSPLTDGERLFLQAVVYDPPGCSGGTGWYRDLYFGSYVYNPGDPGTEPDALIADIHTDPNTSGVFHVATGDPELGIFLAARHGCPLTAFVGPVSSYHEYVTHGFQRLTDQQWDALYRSNAPARPDWTYVYLADRDGNVREGGRLLVVQPDSTGSPSEDEPLGPTYMSITPNPSPSGALVSLRLDGQSPVPVRLRVLDCRGTLVREIHDGWLPPRLVHLRWDGKEKSGRHAGSGIYFLRLEAGNTVTTKKIIVVH